MGPAVGPPKLLVIANPIAGGKECEKVLQEELIPFLTDAGIEFEVFVSRYIFLDIFYL